MTTKDAPPGWPPCQTAPILLRKWQHNAGSRSRKRTETSAAAWRREPRQPFFPENVLAFLLSGLTLTSMTSCAHSGDGVAVCRSWGLRPRRVTASIMSCCRCHSECPPLLAASAEDSLAEFTAAECLQDVTSEEEALLKRKWFLFFFSK